MPGKVKVKILSGRNLPVMDRSSDTTDAYVEIKLGSTTYKTDVCRKSLHPQWNSEWYRFEVDDSELQDEPLQIRLMDHDTYSANDAIGKVYLDLNPLLLPAAGLLKPKFSWNAESSNHDHAPNSVMSGWIPVYDTMHGIRGEVNVIVKVELFTDFNRFRQSSCGIQFFCSKSIPHGYFAQTVHGFVEELIVNDDPEYQWIDKIRTPRASNEARQTLFFKLSGELQRKIGLKALDLGGNAVIGYCQCFDLEGECGIVARGIGTAVTLVKLIDIPHSSIQEPLNEERAQNYLKFLGANASFRLDSSPNSKPDFPFLKRRFPSPLYANLPRLDIENPRYKHLPKYFYSTDFHQQLRCTRSNPTLNEPMPHASVKTLLQQEDMRGTPGYGFGQKIKNFKYSSQSMLSRKMIALKAKLGDSGIGEEDDSDSKSIKSNHSGRSKRSRSPFKMKKSSESSVMAELLARSVLHAHNSLTCILESQDSASSHYDDDEQIVDDDPATPDTLEELETVPNLLAKTASEPFLSVQESLIETNSSNVSSSSSESLSSDDYDDGSDSKDLNYDTVSNIVKNVEILEKIDSMKSARKTFSKQMSLPAFSLDELESEFISEPNPFVFPNFDHQDEEINYTTNVDIDSEEEYTELSKDVSEDLPKAPIAKLESDEELNSSYPVHDAKTIIPPVVMSDDLPIKQKGLVKTAMQTILLDKVNIMGTYTPPISPTSTSKSNVFNVGSPTSSSSSILNSNRNLMGAFANGSIKLPRSSTAVSLDEWGRKHDTVLGAPFVSMHNIRDSIRRQQSHPCLSNANTSRRHVDVNVMQQRQTCFSDSELNKPQKTLLPFKNQPLFSQESINRNKFSFLNLLSRGRDVDAGPKSHLKRGFSHEQLPKRKFSFLHLSRRKSHDPQSNLQKVKSCELHKKRFSILHRSRKSSEGDSTEYKSHDNSGIIANIFHKLDKGGKDHKVDKGEKDDGEAAFKKHGLVGTALGNVVMETVQDILATSHQADKKKEAEPESAISSKSPVFPSSSILTCTNKDNNNPIVSDKALVAVNTEIDKGHSDSHNMHASLTPSLRNDSTAIAENQPEQGHHRAESVGTKMVQSPAKLNSVPCIYRRSSDSDLSITPKGNSLTGSDRSGLGAFSKNNFLRAAQDNFDMLEYPFLTMSKYPAGFILHLGGAVSARSVKLLERISNLEEPESRDTWWSEIRMEIRSHARALNCNAVLGYCETTSICEEVCVLSASGTAAVIGFHYTGEMGDSLVGSSVTKSHVAKDTMATSLDRSEMEKEKFSQKNYELPIKSNKQKTLLESPEHELLNVAHVNRLCSVCHLPYNLNNVPIRATVLKCAACRTSRVPDVLIATIEVPEGTPVMGRGCFIQSSVCRQLKDLRGESNAKEISDGLPFLEYELHRLLINKLKIKGMNSIFGLKIRISIGEKIIIGVATGTAIFLTPLPAPVLPKLVSDRSSDEKKLADLQKLLNDTVKKNREIYQLKAVEDTGLNGKILSDDDSEEEQNSVDLSLGNKDCCILEVDDPEDAEVVNMLMEGRPPDGFHVVNTEFVPGLEELEIVKNLQMFTQIYRAKFQPPYSFETHFHRLLQSVYFKLRRMIPCALCDLQFRVDLPENDEVQLCVLGMALGLGDPQKMKSKRKNATNRRLDEDMIFNLEEDQIPENSVTPQVSQTHLSIHPSRLRQRSPVRNRNHSIKQRHMPYKERHGVDITPLSYVPGAKIEHYLGNLNFFFVRETTSIREEGGLSGFIHSFVTDVLAIVRAHVTALGGNAMVAYFMTECVLNHSVHKNQGQCLINVGGDVVFVSYFKEDS